MKVYFSQNFVFNFVYTPADERRRYNVTSPVNIPKQGLYRICMGKPLQNVQHLYGQALKHNRACTGARYKSVKNAHRAYTGSVRATQEIL